MLSGAPHGLIVLLRSRRGESPDRKGFRLIKMTEHLAIEDLEANHFRLRPAQVSTVLLL